MAFFDPVPEEQLSPESKRYIEMVRKRTSVHTVDPTFFAMTAHKEDVLEMIGISSFWNLATTLGTAMDAGLREE